jgi:hypothetical protein
MLVVGVTLISIVTSFFSNKTSIPSHTDKSNEQVNTPVAQVVSLVDPLEFVKWYYSCLDEQRYEDAWPSLSREFRVSVNNERGPMSFTQFQSFWQDFESISILFLELMAETSENAFLLADLEYIRVSGEVLSDRDSCIQLHHDGESWKIVKKYTDPWRLCVRR